MVIVLFFFNLNIFARLVVLKLCFMVMFNTYIYIYIVCMF